MVNRRTEPRFGANQPAVMSVLAPIPGEIDGASKSGLRVTIAIPVKTGALLEVKWDRAIVVGQVRYCRRTGPDRYRVGLKVMEIVGGAKLQTKPRRRRNTAATVAT